MTFFVMSGQYRVIGAAPDGDSIRFYPNDPEALVRTGLPFRTNSTGGVQLRLDGVDALETHYRPPQAMRLWRQPVDLANAAAAELLDFVGFTSVVRNDNQTVTAAVPEVVDGYIATKFADKYGRAVAFAFAGVPEGALASEGAVFITDEHVASSANTHLLASGAAYPIYYAGLYPDLRAVFTSAVAGARGQAAGVWARDVTTSGFEIEVETDIEDRYVLLPKIFRRLAEYLGTSTEVDMARFRDFLAAYGDLLFTLDTGHTTALDTLIEVVGNRVRLTTDPENIIFLEG